MTPEALDALVASGATAEMIAAAWKAEMALVKPRSTSATRMARKRERDAQASQVTECDAQTVTTSPEVSPNDIYSNPPPTPTASPKASPSPKPRKPAMPRPNDADEAIWRDWTQLRAKQGAPPTETAIAGIRREAGKLGWTLNQALAECCERSWRGFKAEWVQNANGRGNRSGAGDEFGNNGFGRALAKAATLFGADEHGRMP